MPESAQRPTWRRLAEDMEEYAVAERVLQEIDKSLPASLGELPLDDSEALLRRSTRAVDLRAA